MNQRAGSILLARPQPIPELRNVDRARFERDIVPAARPVVLRGLVADWPVAPRGRGSPEALCR